MGGRFPETPPRSHRPALTGERSRLPAALRRLQPKADQTAPVRPRRRIFAPTEPIDVRFTPQTGLPKQVTARAGCDPQ